MGGAESGRQRALQFDGVDGEDLLSAGQAGALQRTGADATRLPMTATLSPGPYVGGIDRRPPTRRHPATHQARLVERDVVQDFHA